mgnify:CR=1 FL=1
MLALSRKKDEAIIINDNIEVKILEIKGDQIKIVFLHRSPFQSIGKKSLHRYRKLIKKLRSL